ncbi:hypothetical protein NE237_019840 [Protea cynaroides]|uniref:Uncharacterized protein n=1 Tax=Protea cynaroides TaxID=273540 RepID=A0A9Q0K2W2_9MAGN|nr:hypothetical protein NE237_019840 [Protea cynaroides]
MIDEDCISWINIVHTTYYTVLRAIPDGRSVNFSMRAEMPNDGYYEVKSHVDVLELVKIFKEEGRAMLLEVYGVNMGDATLDRSCKKKKNDASRQGASQVDVSRQGASQVDASQQQGSSQQETQRKTRKMNEIASQEQGAAEEGGSST